MPVFPSKAEWYSNPQNAQELAELLQNPVLKQALLVLQSEQAKTARSLVTVPVADTGALSEYTLQRQAHTAGFFDCLHALEDLSRQPTPHQPPKPQKPWGHLANPQTPEKQS